MKTIEKKNVKGDKEGSLEFIETCLWLEDVNNKPFRSHALIQPAGT